MGNYPLPGLMEGDGDESAIYRKMFFPSAAILLTAACIGIYGHLSLIWATVRFKYLHSPCNILIALLALADFGHQLSHFSYSFLIFSGITFISLRTCYWIQLLPALFMQHSIINLICLGMDRFYCITHPLGYRNICNSKRTQFFYLLIVNILPVAFSLGLALLAYQEMEKNPDKETLCLIAAFFSGRSEEIWALSTVTLNGLAVLIYILIWIIVWKKSHLVKSVKSTLKPLTIILGLTFFGWFIGMGVAAYISKQEDWPSNLRVGYMAYAGIPINSSIAANYFVYKYFGSDYKKAFRNLWNVKEAENEGNTNTNTHPHTRSQTSSGHV